MIIQIGPYPPPYGGISMYIKRMKKIMDSLNIENEVWNMFSDTEEYGVKKTKLKYLFWNILSNRKSKILHYNISGIKGKEFIYLLNRTVGKNKKNIMTLHGDCKDLFIENKEKMVRVLNSFDVLICVKSGDKRVLSSYGVNTKIFEIPAYIKPIYQSNDEKDIPSNVREFIEEAEFLISANGSISINNNEDLYGLDMLIELMGLIIHEYPTVKLIFCVLAKDKQTDEEKIYYKNLKKIIVERKLNQQIYLFEVENTEFYPILKQSNMFIRPTNTDGDAVSIREALDFNIPCIASDVVVRPKEVKLFKNRDIMDLHRCFKEVKENNEQNIKNKHISMEDNAEKILKIYSNLTKI